MRRGRRRKTGRSGQQGLSMIELLIAMTVLAVGVAGILSLILLAIAGNSRSKGDTTGTMLAQLVIEQIEAQPANAGGTLTIQDCSPPANANRTIALAPGGAQLLADGQIDWGQNPGAIANGYQMFFRVCAPNNAGLSYDVRWNITAQAGSPSGPLTKLVTVSARPAAAQLAGADRLKWFAPPVTLRTIVGR